MEDDDIIMIAMAGAFLSGYSAVRIGEEVIDTMFDTLTDAAGKISKIPKNPILTYLGMGRKGGIL